MLPNSQVSHLVKASRSTIKGKDAEDKAKSFGKRKRDQVLKDIKMQQSRDFIENNMLVRGK